MDEGSSLRGGNLEKCPKNPEKSLYDDFYATLRPKNEGMHDFWDLQGEFQGYPPPPPSAHLWSSPISLPSRCSFLPDFGQADKIQVLHMSGNRLRALPERVFQLKGLVNVQKVYLRNCSLAEVCCGKNAVD